VTPWRRSEGVRAGSRSVWVRTVRAVGATAKRATHWSIHRRTVRPSVRPTDVCLVGLPTDCQLLLLLLLAVTMQAPCVHPSLALYLATSTPSRTVQSHPFLPAGLVIRSSDRGSYQADCSSRHYEIMPGRGGRARPAAKTHYWSVASPLLCRGGEWRVGTGGVPGPGRLEASANRAAAAAADPLPASTSFK